MISRWARMLSPIHRCGKKPVCVLSTTWLSSGPSLSASDTGCELVVRVEQRDGPVAGWESSVKAFALVEQRDAALCHVWRQLSWAIWLEGSLEHSGELWAQLLPEALVELVWQAIKAWCLAPRQGAEGLSEVLERNAAISSCSLSLLLLCWSQVAVDSCKECILGVERCLRWCKEALWCAGAVVCLQGLSCLLRALEAVQCDCLQRLCGCVELRDGRLSLALSGEMVEPEGGLLAVVLPYYPSLDSC